MGLAALSPLAYLHVRGGKGFEWTAAYKPYFAVVSRESVSTGL